MSVVKAAPGDLDLAEAASLEPKEVLDRLASSAKGLSAGEVTERLAKFGPNALGTGPKRQWRRSGARSATRPTS